jgi:hypothetical protein
MSIECGECEHDLRGGHAENCSRHPNNRARADGVQEGGAAVSDAVPWNHPALDGWAIVGMNHYHVEGERRLFVAMTRRGRCIVAEGAEESTVFWKLRAAAAIATPSPDEQPKGASDADDGSAAWKKWCDTLRAKIGARTEWLTLTANVRADNDCCEFINVSLAPTIPVRVVTEKKTRREMRDDLLAASAATSFVATDAEVSRALVSYYGTDNWHGSVTSPEAEFQDWRGVLSDFARARSLPQPNAQALADRATTGAITLGHVGHDKRALTAALSEMNATTGARAVSTGSLLRAPVHVDVSAARPLPDLVVTRDGVPVADQAQGIRDFLDACTPKGSRSGDAGGEGGV